MPHPQPEPGSPADWLRYARSDLAVAQLAVPSPVLLETLCFHLQQAAEKSLKAVLIQLGVPVPRTHNLRTLMELFPATWSVPSDVAMAASLTDYAVTGRYPGDYEAISEEEYYEAIQLAKAVVAWAEGIIQVYGEQTALCQRAGGS